MKKIFFLTLICFFSVAAVAAAHPPSKVDVIYDPATQTAVATIIHMVSNPATHYIFKAELLVNGKVVQEQKFDHQLDNTQEKASFVVAGLKSGDEIAVVGYCNLSGSRGGTLKIE